MFNFNCLTKWYYWTEEEWEGEWRSSKYSVHPFVDYIYLLLVIDGHSFPPYNGPPPIQIQSEWAPLQQGSDPMDLTKQKFVSATFEFSDSLPCVRDVFPSQWTLAHTILNCHFISYSRLCRMSIQRSLPCSVRPGCRNDMVDNSCHFGDLYISEFYYSADRQQRNDLSSDDVVQPRKYSNHKSYELTNNYNKVLRSPRPWRLSSLCHFWGKGQNVQQCAFWQYNAF